MSMTKESIAYGPFKEIFAQAVRKGDTITLAGQVSLDSGGELVGAGDFLAQTRQVYANIAEALSKIGASMDDIVDETVYVTSVGTLMEHLPAWCTARAEAYSSDAPQVSQTCVEVSSLVMPELLIEIKCVARV